jgi:hypothetical protein
MEDHMYTSSETEGARAGEAGRYSDGEVSWGPSRHVELEEAGGMRADEREERSRLFSEVQGLMNEVRQAYPGRAGALSNTGRPKVMPDHFDGRTSWTDYLTHFNSVADLNGWDRRERAQYLAISLRGEACQAMRCLPQDVKNDFKGLVEALNRRFSPGNRTELYRIQLRNRMRREEESLPQLAQAVRNLALQAYPQAEGDLFEALCRDHFLDAISDSSLRFSIFQVQPKSLDEALTIAVETEAFQIAERQRNKKYLREVDC